MNRICKKAVKFIVGHFEYEPHFLARINVWSKIIYKNFLTDLPVGLWWYKVTSYLLINFAHTENTTTQRMIYLISPIQQLEWSQKLKRSAKHVHIYQKKQQNDAIDVVLLSSLEQFSRLILVLQLLTLSR